jgi:serine/threonine protein kinase
VADFGLARSLTNRMQRMITICGSRQYVAPEIIKCERGEETSYDSAVDVWGVGIVTFFVLFG